MQLQESGEMYLETILILSLKGKPVRSIDVVEYMGYSKPSVSRAVGLLKSGGYLEMDQNGYLTLTDEGRRVAERTYERHQLLTEFFVYIGVNPDVAAEDACKIEHVISDETFQAIKKHAGVGEMSPAPFCGVFFDITTCSPLFRQSRGSPLPQSPGRHPERLFR